MFNDVCLFIGPLLLSRDLVFISGSQITGKTEVERYTETCLAQR